ncbi:hypothetical protein L596_030922 [Steinernema carpocapsae]|nr:hypothetical protein L596_030922 [Steinernema carpocapsae]
MHSVARYNQWDVTSSRIRQILLNHRLEELELQHGLRRFENGPLIHILLDMCHDHQNSFDIFAKFESIAQSMRDIVAEFSPNLDLSWQMGVTMFYREPVVAPVEIGDYFRGFDPDYLG